MVVRNRNDLRRFDAFGPKPPTPEPILLWNHRWEYDKNPVAFFAALDELILDGSVDRIMAKYDIYPNAYYRAAIPFRNPYTK